MGKDARYVVRLEDEERIELQTLVDEGRGSRSVRKRARVLLKADASDEGPAWTDERSAEFAEVSISTVCRVRQRFVENGFEAAVYRKPSTDRLYRKLDGTGEARLIATACSEPGFNFSRNIDNVPSIENVRIRPRSGIGVTLHWQINGCLSLP